MSSAQTVPPQYLKQCLQSHQESVKTGGNGPQEILRSMH